MFERIIKLMRDKIRKKQYIMTLHAEEEMNSDDLTIYDVESAILTGKIVERQRDRETAELKYRINGQTLSDDKVEVITKVSPTGKLVIITVYVA
jgi:V8-like Glu-specific endopeptidase